MKGKHKNLHFVIAPLHSTFQIIRIRVIGIHSDGQWDTGVPFLSSTKQTWLQCSKTLKNVFQQERFLSFLFWDAEETAHVKHVLRGTAINVNGCLRQCCQDCLMPVVGRDLGYCREVWSRSTRVRPPPHIMHVGHKGSYIRSNENSGPPAQQSWLRPTGLNMFGPLKYHYECCRCSNNLEVQMAFHEWLHIVQIEFYRDGILTRAMFRINESVCWWTMLKILFTGMHKLFKVLPISR